MTEQVPHTTPFKGKGYREVWLGVFVLFCVGSILALLVLVAEPALLRGGYIVSVVLDDASGLRRGDAVRLRGIPMGRVQAFALRSEAVEVHLELERRYSIARDSTVVVRQASVLGEMAVDVVPGRASERLRHGDQIRGKREETMLGAVDDVAAETSDLLRRLGALLSTENVARLSASSAELLSLLERLNRMAADLGGFGKKLNATMENIEEHSGRPEIQATLENIQQLSARLALVVQRLDRSVASADIILEQVANGDGTLGRLTHDETLYFNANEVLLHVDRTAVELGLLIHDIRQNPGRFLNFSLF